ncbi:gamma-glutamylcyclotransferase family protein [Flagellimonas allohymeniacidonis]|uniref:gamma-glutamylcyclotransferase family protein n=1 Tax=Flagellimonas allohymeniacidonis TaxID=2517819 RepID=UPI0013EEC2B9|nr:gamma-glutamylcyclotransferase family protein [Allomuricauda hymeniacidonis]
MDYLFTYGTLQDAQVQIYVFGKPLIGSIDVLTGFQKTDAAVYQRYPLVIKTNQQEHEVEGVAYEVSEIDLKKADIYETSAYKREKFQLKSGKWAWVYVENSN